jgi:DNA-binding response OmpR family regulator
MDVTAYRLSHPEFGVPSPSGIGLPIATRVDRPETISPVINVSQSTATATVLIIEDSPDVAETLARFLRIGCGYEVDTAPDGLRGIRAAIEHPPDVVICDIGLPKKNGVLVAEELIETLPDRPLLIAVTGYGDAATRGLAAEAGFNHFVVKPADPFFIESLIEDHLKRRSSENAESGSDEPID